MQGPVMYECFPAWWPHRQKGLARFAPGVSVGLAMAWNFGGFYLLEEFMENSMDGLDPGHKVLMHVAVRIERGGIDGRKGSLDICCSDADDLGEG